MSTTPKAWMVTIHYGDGETGAASDVYAGTPEAAEQIAEERSRGFGFISRPIPLYGEHSQPLADELATVKAERDEMREAVVEANAAVMNLETKLRVFEQMLADNPGRYDVRPSMADLSSMIVDAMDARAILAKHPKP